ncbi:hypothetical protein GCM10010176_020150 [Nonomuraea spiralis]|nr:hypothetical protein GCM10010176_020150 [Nonomuraea spiralis]
MTIAEAAQSSHLIPPWLHSDFTASGKGPGRVNLAAALSSPLPPVRPQIPIKFEEPP